MSPLSGDHHSPPSSLVLANVFRQRYRKGESWKWDCWRWTPRSKLGLNPDLEREIQGTRCRTPESTKSICSFLRGPTAEDLRDRTFYVSPHGRCVPVRVRHEFKDASPRQWYVRIHKSGCRPRGFDQSSLPCPVALRQTTQGFLLFSGGRRDLITGPHS